MVVMVIMVVLSARLRETWCKTTGQGRGTLGFEPWGEMGMVISDQMAYM